MNTYTEEELLLLERLDTKSYGMLQIFFTGASNKYLDGTHHIREQDFRECLYKLAKDKIHIPYYDVIYVLPLKDMPLYINTPYIKHIARWRLQIGH